MSTKYNRQQQKLYKEKQKELEIHKKYKKEIEELLNYLKTNSQFNVNRKKLTKHFPLSKSIEENASLEIKDDEIIFTYNNIIKTKKISFVSESNSNYSFTFSECTYEQHLEHIKYQLQIIINQIDFCINNLNNWIENIEEYYLIQKNVYTTYSDSIYYKNVKNKYIDNDGNNIYEIAYNINILIPSGGLLYDSKNNKFMICNCYTIALNNEQKFDIFFDYEQDFLLGHDNLIRKFNQKDTNNLKIINYIFGLQTIEQTFYSNKCIVVNEQTLLNYQNNLYDKIISIPVDVKMFDVKEYNKIEHQFREIIFKDIDLTYKKYYHEIDN